MDNGDGWRLSSGELRDPDSIGAHVALRIAFSGPTLVITQNLILAAAAVACVYLMLVFWSIVESSSSSIGIYLR